MKKRIFCAIAALVMLFTVLTGSLAEMPAERVRDKANVLNEAQERFLEERIAILQEAYDLDIALITVNSSKSSKLEAEAKDFEAVNGLRNALILTAGTAKGDYSYRLIGTAEDVFSGEILKELDEESYFPLFFEEKSFSDGFDAFLDDAEGILSDYASRMECSIGDARITDGGKGKAKVSLNIGLINYSDSAILIRDALKATLEINGKAIEGKISFPYKSVYSLEELQGTVTFDADGKSIKDGIITIACLHAVQTVPLKAVRDDRTEAQKRSSETKAAPKKTATPAPAKKGLDKNGIYTSKEDVAAYLRQYGKLPVNYITKSEAQKLGWDSSRGNLWDVAPGKSIGGDHFGNYEGLLPGGSYTECDIGYKGGYRDSRRLVFRKDGKDWHIYYTEDHYQTFTEVR